jgi:GNAT superfamily N-acetyltransferase
MLLRATDVFSEEEIDIATELIDAVLQNPSHEDYVIHVCEEHGSVCGYYCVGPTPATAATFDLYWIAVDPAMQGKRIGKGLEEHAVEAVRARGGRLIIAETSSQPKYAATREFYLRRGYAEVARIKEYYRPGDDLVVYGKYLTQS